MRQPIGGSPGEGSQPALSERPGASGFSSAHLSTFPAHCIFCAHVNPEGAKFCNDCGSPLHLKPCRQCDAINDRSARRCYNCGIADPVPEPTTEPVPKVVDGDDTVASPAPADIRIEAGPATQPSSVVEHVDEISQPDFDPTPKTRAPDTAVATPQPSLMEPVAISLPAEAAAEGLAAEGPARDEISQPDVNPTRKPPAPDIAVAMPQPSLMEPVAISLPAEAAADGLAAEGPPRSRFALAGLLSAALVAAVAVYIYRSEYAPQQPLDSGRATAPAIAPAEQIPAKIDVPAAAPASVNAPSTSGASSPLPQDGVHAPGPANIGEPTLTPSQSPVAAPSQPEPAANEQAPSVVLATKADPVAEAPAAAAVPRDSRAPIPSQMAKKPATNAKTTAKKSKKTSTKKVASSPAAPAAKATTTELPKSAE